MEWIELTGKTIDEARDLALDKLGVHETEAEIEVLEHPSVSMFGRVKSLARIRARVAPVAAPAKEERRRKGGSRNGGGSKSPAQQQEKPKQQGSAPAAKQAAAASASGGSASGGSRSDGGSDSSGGRSQRDRDRNGDQGRSKPADSGPTPDPMTAPEVAETVEGFLGGLMAAAGHTVTTSNEIDGERVDVAVSGDDLGLMVGHRGATADAVLELSKAVMLKVAKGGTDVRLGVDVGGYKVLRREVLESFATDLAGQVVESGEPMVLESMGSIDRKIVHDAANAVDGVSTESEGQGRERRVVIRPS